MLAGQLKFSMASLGQQVWLVELLVPTPTILLTHTVNHHQAIRGQQTAVPWLLLGWVPGVVTQVKVGVKGTWV